jgi:hypothetical protein
MNKLDGRLNRRESMPLLCIVSRLPKSVEAERRTSDHSICLAAIIGEPRTVTMTIALKE